MEELKAKHKKELKTLESDKRISLKKIKGTAGKGKKGKEALAEAEAEWDAKLRALEEKHEREIQDLTKTNGDGEVDVLNDDGDDDDAGNKQNGLNVAPSLVGQEKQQQQQEDEEAVARQKKLEKKLRKKKNALAKQREKEEQIAKEMAEAPNHRQIEMNAIMELHLNKHDLDIEEVTADGNCLYRAVAKQMEYLSKSQNEYDYIQIRQLCAQELDDNRHEYEPFADLVEMKVSSFDEYVEKVRDSNEWGGHLELRALAHKLKRTIEVYSTDGLLEIVGFEKQQGGSIVDGYDGEKEEVEEEGMNHVIRLSFHRQYYALGEHYNSVISRQNVPRQ